MSIAVETRAESEDIVIARIVKARGIRGEVACAIETDFPERFSSLETASLRMPDGRRLSLKVEDCWFHQDRVILKFEGYDTMTSARELVGGIMVISEADVEPVADDEFFEHQLIGSEVVTADGKTLGQVSGLVRTGGTDVLVIGGTDGRERLIPFADEICTEVDVSAKRITVCAPEGLLEL
ncbi:MAG TPA: ribosome maturation factor RimM [Blastocatellia bacterium]|nr:ribosome maturation factor RimM [Blastocatellia bacterium]